MAITEDRRHDLYEGLIDVLGREKATTLMEHLPRLGSADVATKRDLDHQTLATRRDLEIETGKLRDEMHTGFADIRAEMSGEFASVRAEMSGELASVRAEIADLRTEVAAVEARFERALRDQGRTFVLAMLSANATLAGLAFAAAQIT
ncbi:MAG TPA: hypothetical protein VFP06_05535 [Acidimicrobiales bacterium]|nr:hypothetical protein [Acidimicrobiales bacterium]